MGWGEAVAIKNYIILTGISEQPDLRKGILKQGLKKKTVWIFIIIGWLCRMQYYYRGGTQG